MVYHRKKTNRNNRNKTKKKNRTRTYCTNALALLMLVPQVCLAKVRASPGVTECLLFPLDSPVPHAHVHSSSHPISPIFDNKCEYDPLPSFTFARDSPEGLKIFLEEVHPNVADRPLRLGSCTLSRPNITLFESLESPYRKRAPANRSWRFRIIVVSMRWQPILS